MAKHDAFGREMGEDTLADAGWRSRGESSATVEVEPGPEPASTPGPTPVATRRPRAGRMAVLAVLATLAAVGVGGALAVSAVVDSFEETVGGSDVPDFDTILGQPRQVPVPGAAAKGLEPGSLLRPDRLAPALSALRDAGGGVLMLRLAPDRIDAQLHRGSDMLMVRIDPDARLEEVVRAPVPGGVTTIEAARIDADAPQRLLGAARRRFDLPPDEVDYLVLLDLGGEASWSAFYRGGTVHVQGRLDGSIIRRAS